MQGQCLNNVDILSCNVYCLSLRQLVSLMERHQDSMEGDSSHICWLSQILGIFVFYQVADVHSHVISADSVTMSRFCFY